jgi:Flp pilus assembly protein TadB
MLAGVLLIIAGISIAVYPPLLSLIVAVLLVLLGAVVITIAYYDRRLSRHHDNPAIELFLRF